MVTTLPSLSASFCPLSLAAPNASSNSRTANQSSTSKPIPRRLPSKRSNHKLRAPPPATTTRSNSRRNFSVPPPLSSPVCGGDATTYTRLPPQDDFFSTSSNSSFLSCTEIKLLDSAVAHVPSQKTVIKHVDAWIDEHEDLEVDYGKFELFEINSDPEDEVDSEDDGEDILGFEESRDVFDGEGLEEEEEGKVKGLPAVMRCFDRAKIYVKAGDGGKGVVAFRREKYVPMGGPSGGDGGRGGNVYVEVDRSMNSLLPFRQCVHFRAGRGEHGQGRKQNGAKGEDVVVKVPPGTVIREASMDGEHGEVLLELLHAGQRALLLPGGRGGRGNASFKSGINKVPKIAENGEEGPEMYVLLF